jgi:hypothetical protein
MILHEDFICPPVLLDRHTKEFATQEGKMGTGTEWYNVFGWV